MYLYLLRALVPLSYWRYFFYTAVEFLCILLFGHQIHFTGKLHNIGYDEIFERLGNFYAVNNMRRRASWNTLESVSNVFVQRRKRSLSSSRFHTNLQLHFTNNSNYLHVTDSPWLWEVFGFFGALNAVIILRLDAFSHHDLTCRNFHYSNSTKMWLKTCSKASTELLLQGIS